MTSFSRYYESHTLINISMDQIGKLITDSKNKDKIADYVYQRLYTRFLKIFDFECNESKDYDKNGKIENLNVFKEEYKNGFIMMVSCSLLIETLASYIEGSNKTLRPNCNAFKKVFEYAEKKNNDLKLFSNLNFYEHIRCGLLHQGEVYGKFKITRKGTELINAKDETINAYLFLEALKELLNDYKVDLYQAPWDSRLWDACRLKIRYIIKNAK